MRHHRRSVLLTLAAVAFLCARAPCRDSGRTLPFAFVGGRLARWQDAVRFRPDGRLRRRARCGRRQARARDRDRRRARRPGPFGRRQDALRCPAQGRRGGRGRHGQGGRHGRIPVGPWPVAVALAEKAEAALHLQPRQPHGLGRRPGRRQEDQADRRGPRPGASRRSRPTSAGVVVANYMPRGAGTDPRWRPRSASSTRRPGRSGPRSSCRPARRWLGGVCISPDGKWAYVVHALGRFNLPITQLERGWVHTYALSIIDVAAGTRSGHAAAGRSDGRRGRSLGGGRSRPTARRSGSATPASTRSRSSTSAASTSCSKASVPAELAALKDGTRDNIWVRISKDTTRHRRIDQRPDGAVHRRRDPPGAIRRQRPARPGPFARRAEALRGQLLRRHGRRARRGRRASCWRRSPSGRSPQPDAARRGEIYFHDATRCFQHWHSCATCHLDGGASTGCPGTSCATASATART